MLIHMSPNQHGKTVNTPFRRRGIETVGFAKARRKSLGRQETQEGQIHLYIERALVVSQEVERNVLGVRTDFE